MKKLLFPLLAIIGLSTVVIAQDKQKKAPAKIVYNGQAYLSGGKYANGGIGKKALDSLIPLPLVVIDSLGKEHKTTSFKFNYGEIGAFEDEKGRLIFDTDWTAYPTEGAAINESLKKMLPETKWGDTLVIDEIFYEITTSKTKSLQRAKPIKLYINDK